MGNILKEDKREHEKLLLEIDEGLKQMSHILEALYKDKLPFLNGIELYKGKRKVMSIGVGKKTLIPVVTPYGYINKSMHYDLPSKELKLLHIMDFYIKEINIMLLTKSIEMMGYSLVFDLKVEEV